MVAIGHFRDLKKAMLGTSSWPVQYLFKALTQSENNISSVIGVVRTHLGQFGVAQCIGGLMRKQETPAFCLKSQILYGI